MTTVFTMFLHEIQFNYITLRLDYYIKKLFESNRQPPSFGLYRNIECRGSYCLCNG